MAVELFWSNAVGFEAHSVAFEIREMLPLPHGTSRILRVDYEGGSNLWTSELPQGLVFTEDKHHQTPYDQANT